MNLNKTIATDKVAVRKCYYFEIFDIELILV